MRGVVLMGVSRATAGCYWQWTIGMKEDKEGVLGKKALWKIWFASYWQFTVGRGSAHMKKRVVLIGARGHGLQMDENRAS